MNYHIHYDLESGRILGFYCKGISNAIPSPTIQVSEEVKKEIEMFAHRYRVVDRRLEENKQPQALVAKVRQDVGEFNFNDATYVADRMFLSNLSLNLSICNSKKDHTCKFWCVIDGEFQKREHGADELMQLAQTYEKARAELMGE